ncbi:MAG: hypothetical protein COX48_00250 [bacterium (Candidatus Stahlbacteria) CG23_combo_of_CG06-09_8_20_14_all_34_7]|nr:MAG: hypothetical protein COX48_00250 [bacterium (Candidatus Stahlbacteria) CG23_combo_of_CG06-09_8_20_14_all_34_7]
MADPHRPNHELIYFPGTVNIRTADVIVINKIDSAIPSNVEILRQNIAVVNPTATVIEAASPVSVDKPELIKGKRVAIIEDGPTLTHGEMKYGAGVVAAKRFGAKEIIDPHPYAVGEINATYKKYSEAGAILPAMGYSGKQIADLEKTINKIPCDTIIVATPINLARLIKINKPAVRVSYNLQEIGKPSMTDVINDFLKSKKIKKNG